MKSTLQTERLYFREFTIDDAQLLIDLNSDTDVTRYTGDGSVKDIEEAKRILTEIIFPQYQNKIGRLAVHLKSTNEFIGWCGLKHISKSNEVDLGYHFFKKHWNKGYATESAKTMLDYGTTVLKLKNIIALSAKENTASIHVLKKIGMTYLEDDVCQHDPAEKYILASTF